MNPLSLTFRHEFDHVSKLNDSGKNSKIRFCSGLPWHIHIFAECSDFKRNEKVFGMFLFCNDEDSSKFWCCEHDSTIKLINRIADKYSITCPINKIFDAKLNYWGCPSVFDWDDLLKREEGFIENDKIIVEASITVKKTYGLPKSLQFDFTVPGFGSDNVAFNVKGRKVYADKKYLALHSDVFKAMFFGEFPEKNNKEIKLTGVSHEEFIEFLYVFYPSFRMITFDSYEFILTLADKYQVEYALNAAESYLMKTAKLTSMEKLVLADRFHLDSLTELCLAEFKSLKQIKAMKTQLTDLSSDTQAAIMLRMIELI